MNRLCQYIDQSVYLLVRYSINKIYLFAPLSGLGGGKILDPSKLSVSPVRPGVCYSAESLFFRAQNIFRKKLSHALILNTPNPPSILQSFIPVVSRRVGSQRAVGLRDWWWVLER